MYRAFRALTKPNKNIAPEAMTSKRMLILILVVASHTISIARGDSYQQRLTPASCTRVYDLNRYLKTIEDQYTVYYDLSHEEPSVELQCVFEIPVKSQRWK